MRTKLFNALKVSALALLLSFGLSFVYAWTAPTISAPNGNVSAPINTSNTPQIKAGGLTVGGLTLPAGSAITGSGAKSTYGSLTVNGSKNGWQGVNFPGAGTVMMHPSYSGFYNAADGAWRMLVTDTGGTGDLGNGNVYANDYYSYAAGKWVSEFKSRVTGSCAAGQAITAINADGTVTCGVTYILAQQTLSVSGLSNPTDTDIPLNTPNTCGQGGSYPVHTIPGFEVKGPTSTHSGGVLIAPNKSMTIDMSAYLDYGYFLWVSVNGGTYTNIASLYDGTAGQSSRSGSFTYNLNLPTDGYATFAHSAGGCWQNYYISGSFTLNFLI